LAHTINFAADRTSISTKFLNIGEAGVSAGVVGPKYTIELFSGPATLSNRELFDFTSGTLTVTNTITGVLVFGDSVTGGDADIHGDPFRINGGGPKSSFSFQFFGGGAAGAGASVSANVPEPARSRGFCLEQASSVSLK
jgi:hypothetical protein